MLEQKSVAFTPEQIKLQEQKEQGEMWKLSDIKGGRHVVHPGFDERLGLGDKGASLTIEQIVEFAYRWFPQGSVLITGPHSGPDFSEMIGGEKFVGADGEIDYKGYLLTHRREIERAKAKMAAGYPREKYPLILFGLEADLGNDQMWPPEKVLQEMGPDGPDFVIGSFHYERIPKEWQTGKYFYQGFMRALESGVVHKFGHPLWELHLVREWDAEKFQQLIDLAKEKGVPFEVSSARLYQLSESEPTSVVLHALVKNGNLIDFGMDFHSFLAWMKKSAVVPEITRSKLSQADWELLQHWQETKDFSAEFKQKERAFWKGALADVLARDIQGGISEDQRQVRIYDYLWRVYKGRDLPEFAGAASVGEREEVFVKLRDQFLDELIPPDAVPDWQGLQADLRKELTQLFALYQNQPPTLSQAEKTQLEQVFVKVGVNLGDLKRTLQAVRRLKTQFSLPRAQFVNVWSVEEQLEQLERGS